jgi:ubiquinone/menaquinone biosynthesis C-methylase UbiE
MLNKLYGFFHKKISRPEERGEYSAGYWQDMIRRKALEFSAGITGKIIEVGCGEGLFLSALAKKNSGSEIYGIDIDKDLLNKAKGRLKGKGARLSVADARQMPFEDSFFDCVICINVIFNLRSLNDAGRVLSEAGRILKKGGRVIVDFRNRKNPLLNLKYKLAPLYDETVKDMPLKTYTYEELGRLTGAAGLRIEKTSRMGFFAKGLAPIVVLDCRKI